MPATPCLIFGRNTPQTFWIPRKRYIQTLAKSPGAIVLVRMTLLSPGACMGPRVKTKLRAKRKQKVSLDSIWHEQNISVMPSWRARLTPIRMSCLLLLRDLGYRFLWSFANGIDHLPAITIIFPIQLTCFSVSNHEYLFFFGLTLSENSLYATAFAIN